MSEKNYISKENITIRMFDNDIMEYFTHIPPLAPHIIYWPVVGYMLYASVINAITLPLWTLHCAFGGLFWCFTEYSMHRFLFHMTPTKPWHKKLHWMLHGIHHDYPQDATRLVMPLQVSIPLTILFFLGFKLAVGPINVYPFFTGFIVGYLFYDTIHYAVHHLKIKQKWLLKLKSRHMNHHYVDPKHNFHVSGSLIDKIFGTYKA
jgi:4-hydroxysphinganine ceramide fatty acyl 2-hydroxylase